MIIRHAILHIIDKDSGNLIASQDEMSLDTPTVHDYLAGIINKFDQGDFKPGQLTDADYLGQMINAESDVSFVDRSTQLAEKLFAIIAASPDVPAGDLFFVEYAEGQDDFFAILKMNLAPHYTHMVDYRENDLVNQVILNQAILPDPSQRIQEGVVVNLMTGEFQLVEKQYIIDGHRVNYFSEKFLEVDPEESTKDNIKAIKQTVKKVANKFDIPEHEAFSKTQDAILDSMHDNNGDVRTADIADAVFAGNVAAKTAYNEIATDKSLDETFSVPNQQAYEKKYQVQRFKLDSGIEIAIPTELYQDKTKVEFINNPDGSMSLVIKDIESIINKFTS
ncbi:nucleoid-associated protein [Weissella ceti]|uniref:Nucleoid-associated protein n=1 Tax=Weissella ceti TaxID=759620 RepID=A0ABT3E6G6_9LACO|nr:nucleoid-associated protein [Weissella ceti]MCW0953859.1 nucleoid-associated protein [Weissella ceti]QVK12593.1 nucleoid-associated protein [Weissella ceti]